MPRTARPGYLAPVVDPTFGLTVTRITGDAGAEFTLERGRGVWGTDARHHYSKDQPWNADGTLLAVENPGKTGGRPSIVLLDGETYRPIRGRNEAYKLDEFRWHPSRDHAREQIGVRGDSLVWVDAVTGQRTRGWKLPFRAIGIGLGEGNPSNDGHFLALANADSIAVVDMDPAPPLKAYGDGNRRVGPVYVVGPSSVGVEEPARRRVGFVTVSASGRYLAIKYGGVSGDSAADAIRIFDIDPKTLAISPHTMAAQSLRCGSSQVRQDGWIFPLKHADFASNPFDRDEDVVIGGRSCPGSGLGRVVMVRLRDGAVTALTDPKDEASVGHVSTRNLDRPGWAYVTYLPVPGKRFECEIVAVKLDGSMSVERYTHHHSQWNGCYRCEAQAVPSRDGRRVVFASNWSDHCSTCGKPDEINDYVVDARARSDSAAVPRH